MEKFALYCNCTNTLNTVGGVKVIKLDYKDSRPIHEQITHGIKGLIMCGALAPDEQLPSVRDLSVSLTVNPNTVQRAYKNLEAENIIYSVKGKGNFVSGESLASEETIKKLYGAFSEAVRELIFYGEDKEKLITFLKEAISETEEKK